MPRKQHVVQLTTRERAQVAQLIRAGSAPARTLARARILLKADCGGRTRRWSDVEIAEAVEVSPRTVARTRAAFCQRGLAATLHGQPVRRVYPRKLDGLGEAKLIELACGPAPAGQERWSLRLLSDALVALEVVEAIAPNTVRAVLKKTSSNRGGSGSGACRAAIPPS
jgi:hypothetical protein